jgi:hypothetical protein
MYLLNVLTVNKILTAMEQNMVLVQQSYFIAVYSINVLNWRLLIRAQPNRIHV